MTIKSVSARCVCDACMIVLNNHGYGRTVLKIVSLVGRFREDCSFIVSHLEYAIEGVVSAHTVER
jgi:hypothetical protein